MKKKQKIIPIIVVALIMSFMVTGMDGKAIAATKPGKVSYSSIKASSVGYYSMSFKWNKASNAKKYKVAFRHSSKRAWRYASSNTASVTLDNLLPNTTYSVKIQSINGSKTSDWTSTKSFKTKQTPYTKSYSPKSIINKHVVGIVEGGWVAVVASSHITEKYKNEGNYKKFGYRCYGTTFTSSNAKSLLNQLNCSIWTVKHHTAYTHNGKTKYKEVKCNVYSCIHDHIYSGDAFQRPEKDSTTVVSHKENTTGYITLGYAITGPLVYSPSKTVKFSDVAK